MIICKFGVFGWIQCGWVVKGIALWQGRHPVSRIVYVDKSWQTGVKRSPNNFSMTCNNLGFNVVQLGKSRRGSYLVC